jgi:hypothetical protein
VVAAIGLLFVLGTHSHAQTGGFAGPPGKVPSHRYGTGSYPATQWGYSHGGMYTAGSGYYFSTPATSGYYFGRAYTGPTVNYAGVYAPGSNGSSGMRYYSRPSSPYGAGIPPGALRWQTGYGAW